MSDDLRALLQHNAVLSLILEFLAPSLQCNTFHRCSALVSETLISDADFTAGHSAAASKIDYLSVLSTHRYVPNLSEELFLYQQRLEKVHRSERKTVTMAQFAQSLRSKWRPRVAMWDVLALSMTCRSVCSDISCNLFWKERLMGVVCPSDANMDVDSVTSALTSGVFETTQLASTSEGVDTMCQAWKSLYLYALREHFFTERPNGPLPCSSASCMRSDARGESDGPLSSMWQELKGLMSLKQSKPREFTGADFLCHESRNKLLLLFSPIPSDSLFDAVDVMKCLKGSCLEISLDVADVSTTRIFVGGLQNAVPIAFVSGIPMRPTTPTFLSETNVRANTNIVADFVTLDICRTQRPGDILGPYLDAAVILVNLCWLPLTRVVSQWQSNGRESGTLTRRDLCDSSREWSRIVEVLCDCHYVVQQTQSDASRDRRASVVFLLHGSEQRLSMSPSVMRSFLKDVLIPVIEEDRQRFVATTEGFQRRSPAEASVDKVDWVISSCSLSFPFTLRNAISSVCC